MDPVSKPSHYMLFADGTEAIDIIKQVLTPEEFKGYCKGNVLKYRLRAGKKDKLGQDIAKADTYAKMLDAAIGPRVAVYHDEVQMDFYDHVYGVEEPAIKPKKELEEDYECTDCATCMNLNCPRR